MPIASLLFLALWSFSAPLLIGGWYQARAAENQSVLGIPDKSILFDIPSQPIEDALYAFGSITGIEVFVDGRALDGRRSNAVKGKIPPTQALAMLVAGSGLTVHLIGVRAITLSVDPSSPSSTVRFREYSAILQKAALSRLCGLPEARLGDFRIAVQLWLNAAGGVTRAELLSSSGDQIRDEGIRDLLTGISLASPPQGMPQPIVMVILPRATEDSGDCTARQVPSRPSKANGSGDRGR